jgi:hypothetical protein
MIDVWGKYSAVIGWNIRVSVSAQHECPGYWFSLANHSANFFYIYKITEIRKMTVRMSVVDPSHKTLTLPLKYRPLPCTLYSTPQTPLSQPHTRCFILHALYPIPHTINPVPYTILPLRCTLYPDP